MSCNLVTMIYLYSLQWYMMKMFYAEVKCNINVWTVYIYIYYQLHHTVAVIKKLPSIYIKCIYRCNIVNIATVIQTNHYLLKCSSHTVHKHSWSFCLSLPFFLFFIPMNKNEPLFVLGSPKNEVKEKLDFCPSVSPPPVSADVRGMC